MPTTHHKLTLSSAMLRADCDCGIGMHIVAAAVSHRKPSFNSECEDITIWMYNMIATHPLSVRPN